MKSFVPNAPREKALRFTGLRTSSSTPTEEQLVKINQFTRRPFTAEEVYVGQLWLANNAIDRDGERYNEEILQHFNDTITRKTFLLDHGKYDIDKNAVGKFFDSVIDAIPLDQARAVTGEDIELPPGVTDVLFLAPWFYIPREGVDPKTLVKIDAGVFDFSSIGYRAERLVPITDQKGTVLYYEYQGRGEATEGSLVYLGAQYGAGMKSLEEKPGTSPGNDPETPQGGKPTMTEFLKRLLLTFNKAFTDGMTEDQAIASVKALMDEKDGKIATLTTELAGKDAKIAELAPLASDGKAFRDKLVTDYVTSKAKLGEVAETPEAQAQVREVAGTYPISFLQSEVKTLRARVEEKFPSKGQLTGDERRDKSADGEKGWKEKNPLVPED